MFGHFRPSTTVMMRMAMRQRPHPGRYLAPGRVAIGDSIPAAPEDRPFSLAGAVCGESDRSA